MSTTVCCQIIDDEKLPVGDPFQLSVENTDYVSDLVHKLKICRGLELQVQIKIWKLCVPRTEITSEFSANVKLVDEDIVDMDDQNAAFRLNPTELIQLQKLGPWPTQMIHALVQFRFNDRIGKRQYEEEEEEDTEKQQFKRLKRDIAHRESSSLAAPSQFSVLTSNNIVRCNRPFSYNTIPIELLEETFGIFKVRCGKSPSPKALQLLSYITPDACQWDSRGFRHFETAFEHYTGLWFAFRPGTGNTIVDGCPRYHDVMPAVIRECDDDHNGHTHALNQAIVLYGKSLVRVVDHPLHYLHRYTRFPCILMIDRDATLGFYGAIWNGEHVQVEPLTPIFNLTTHYMDKTGRQAIASSFDALIEAVVHMQSHYATIREKVMVNSYQATFIDSVRLPEARKYPYLRTFLIGGQEVTLNYLTQIIDTKLVFYAKDPHNSKEYFIKFMQPRYGAEAHTLLAKHGFAPKLWYCDEIFAGSGGWIAVIMDRSRFELNRDSNFEADDRERIRSKVREAMELLHDEGFVHGHIRQGNILVSTDSLDGDGEVKIHIVDFDWAGKIGEVKYPLDINPEAGWPEGVQGGGLITVDDEIAMLSYL